MLNCLVVSTPLVRVPYSSTREILTANACVGTNDSLLDSPNFTITETEKVILCCIMAGGPRVNPIIVLSLEE